MREVRFVHGSRHGIFREINIGYSQPIVSINNIRTWCNFVFLIRLFS